MKTLGRQAVAWLRRHPRLILPIISAIIGLCCIPLAYRVASAAHRLGTNVAEAQEVLSVGREIRELRERGARQPWLNWQERESELGSLLEHTANEAGIYRPRLVSIEPLRSRMLDRRLGERIIRVGLQDVQLEELTKLLHGIQSQRGAPAIKELHLTRSRENVRIWGVTLSLSLVFDVGGEPGAT